MGVDIDRADAVAHSVIQAMKALRSLRQQLPKPAAGVDHSAYPVLFRLAHDPARVSAVAEAIGSDISTISRQVGQLIDAGLAVRTSDPDDGRAHLVELTPDGHDVVDRTREIRAEWFREVLHDWTPQEADALVAGLDRLRTSVTSASKPSPRKETA